jgi:hypothetical protein
LGLDLPDTQVAQLTPLQKGIDDGDEIIDTAGFILALAQGILIGQYMAFKDVRLLR